MSISPFSRIRDSLALNLKKKKKKTCNCSRSRRSLTASSNPVAPYIPRGEKFDKIFRCKEEDLTVPEPSYTDRINFYLKYYAESPERPTSPRKESSMHFSGKSISDLVFPENHGTTDHSNDVFDWSAWQDELLKIAGEIGIPRSGSEQYDIVMQRLEKNTVFKTLSESFKSKNDKIREDSSLGPILEQIQSGGPAAMKRYWNDKDLLCKLGVALGEIVPEHDDSFTDTFATSEEKVFQPTMYDWDNLRARLFVMLLAQ